MANPLVECATGTSIAFATTTFVANLIKIGLKGAKRGHLDTSYMGMTVVTGALKYGTRTFIPTLLSDPGELDIEFHYNPDKLPPIETAAETITITFPKGSSSTAPTWAASGFLTDFEFQGALEDLYVATGKIKWSGNVIITAAT